MVNCLIHSGILLAAMVPGVLILVVLRLAARAARSLGPGDGPPQRVLRGVAFGVCGLAQVYFWGAWAAFCVAVTARFTAKPDVTWEWLYWVDGFMWCTALLGWLVRKKGRGSPEGRSRPNWGVALYSVISVACYIGFAVWPRMALPPYGWLLGLVGLEGSME